MSKAVIQEKIRKLESELELIKKSLDKKPDFDIDEKIWKEVEPTVRKIRKQLYKEVYGKR